MLGKHYFPNMQYIAVSDRSMLRHSGAERKHLLLYRAHVVNNSFFMYSQPFMNQYLDLKNNYRSIDLIRVITSCVITSDLFQQ